MTARPMAWPAASTRLVTLLGWPTDHSLSPVMHNAAFAHDGLDLVYVAMPTPPASLNAVVQALGDVGAVGANVTVPHKQAVVTCCDEVSAEADLVGAVNTLVWRDGVLRGDNTDADGLRRDLAGLVGDGPVGRAVVLGTGGAARAAVVALARLGAEIAVVGRRPDAVDDLVEVTGMAGAAGSGVVLGSADVADAVGRADVIVNATPLGMRDEPLPEPFMRLREGQIAYDLVYNPPRTPFLASAAAAGAIAANGIGMLVGQAAAAYERWTGHTAPIEVMRAAVDAGVS